MIIDNVKKHYLEQEREKISHGQNIVRRKPQNIFRF